MMETLGMMGAGLLNALAPINLFAIIASTTLGIVIGCLPGLSAAMGVALLLPVTFGMDPGTGLIVLGGIYCGAIFGGSISAILIHTPGTPASAATALEGYQMTLQGKAAKALAVACFASFFGGLMSCVSPISETVFYKTFSYSQEYNAFPEKDPIGEELLKLLAKDGRGVMISDSTEVFASFEKTLQMTYDPRILFLILTIIFVLLDIAVRKFKFKWPHELIRERKMRKAEKISK